MLDPKFFLRTSIYTHRLEFVWLASFILFTLTNKTVLFDKLGSIHSFKYLHLSALLISSCSKNVYLFPLWYWRSILFYSENLEDPFWFILTCIAVTFMNPTIKAISLWAWINLRYITVHSVKIYIEKKWRIFIIFVTFLENFDIFDVQNVP